MIKRFISLGICLLMVFSAVSSVFAAQPAFTDIDDLQTARDAEVLRLMGVIEGYGDGSFKPANSLTRAQFCKMAICMMGLEQDSAKYSNITIFPDVRASHWAAPYINLAAKGEKIIAGFDDGLFRPNQPITSGQAVTIILRIMGYKDDKVGGVWPDSFMAAGQSIGLLEGCGFTGGRQTITRAQAARLFVNMLTCEKESGGNIFDLASDEVVFKTIDPNTGKMVITADDKDNKYDMVNAVEGSMLEGMTGRLVTKNGKALTFIPSDNSTGIYDGLVIVAADGSTVGFKQLSGDADYKLYRDGKPATVSDIKKWDVATYDPATNSLRLCSTRLRVYYEDCTGSPKSPDTITIMGGRVFQVMDSAKASLAKFKPSQDMYVLFTIDGQIAGAAALDADDIANNLIGEVSTDGALTVEFCGKDTVISKSVENKFYGYPVLVTSYRKEGPRVRYINLDDVDGTMFYGRVNVSEERDWVNNPDYDKFLDEIKRYDMIQKGYDPDATDTDSEEKDPYVFQLNDVEIADVARVLGLTIPEKMVQTKEFTVVFDCGPKGRFTFNKRGSFTNNMRAATKMYNIYSESPDFSWVDTMEQLSAVPNSTWLGKEAVTYGSGTYVIDKDTVFYNLDTESWSTMDKCLEYSTRTNMYVYDGAVRLVEFSAD